MLLKEGWTEGHGKHYFSDFIHPKTVLTYIPKSMEFYCVPHQTPQLLAALDASFGQMQS